MRARESSLMKFAGQKLAGKRQSLQKNDMHLTWKLPDTIVKVLRFDCHGRVLSEMLLSCLCFFCVSLKLIRSWKENQMVKA